MGWVVNASLLPPYPGNDPVAIVQEGRWAPVSVWTPTGVRPPHPPRSVAIPASLSWPTFQQWLKG